MGTIRNNIILFIAQGGYAGRLPHAPGTAGTAVAAMLCFALRDADYCLYAFVAAAVTGIGTWVADEADRLLGTKDSPTIVIDEIAGFLVALFLVPFTWVNAAVGFGLFRFFDIAKPWPLKRLQQIPGGPGVMLDDLAAGVYANVMLQIMTAVFNP